MEYVYLLEYSWTWLILGTCFLLLELATIQFAFIFLSIGFYVVGLLKVFFDFDLGISFLLFSIVTIIGFLFFRYKILKFLSPRERVENDIGQSVIVPIVTSSQESVIVSYQGSPWTAVNCGDEKIEAGEKVHIQKIEGNRLFISKSVISKI